MNSRGIQTSDHGTYQMKIPLICSWMRQHGRRQEPLGNETLSEEGKAVGHLWGWDKGFRRQTP